MATKNFKRVYVWELPVRIFHWLNALAITVLIVTGFIISNPPAIMSKLEASQQFWFGYVRKIHFIAAYVMVAVMILRVYWAFVGNKFANWRTFFPFNKKGMKNIWHVLKFDIFLQNEQAHKIESFSIGHNSVATASYLVMFILALLMMATGFAMYAPTASWFFPKMFAWVTPLFNDNEMLIRKVHHISMWAFILFIVVHVYLVMFHDWLEGRGETSAMISGQKFVSSERVHEETEK